MPKLVKPRFPVILTGTVTVFPADTESTDTVHSAISAAIAVTASANISATAKTMLMIFFICHAPYFSRRMRLTIHTES